MDFKIGRRIGENGIMILINFGSEKIFPGILTIKNVLLIKKVGIEAFYTARNLTKKARS